MWLALYGLAALAALQPRIDWDIWWHLRTGQWVVVYGTVPTTDPFSRHGLESGKPWLAYSWLFEVLVYGLYSRLGLTGIVVYRVALSLVVVAALHRLIAKREPQFLHAAGLLGLALVAIIPLLNERPWLFTILFTTLTLDAILDLRQGTAGKSVWLLPVMFALWASLHIQFVYGLLLLGLALAAPAIDRYGGFGAPTGHADTLASPDWRRLAALAALCFAATLVNPYHVRLYGVVAEYALYPGPYRLVAELAALEFRGLWDWAVLALLGWAAFALGRRQAPSSFDVLLLAGAAVLTFRARRDLWVGTVAALAVLVTSRPAKAEVWEFLPSWRQALVVGAAVAALVIAAFLWLIPENRLRAGLEKRFPVRVVALVRAKGYAGPLFNDFNWGGFLIWHLPELPVAMDGRTNLHGDERLIRSLAVTWTGQPGWDGDPDLESARLVIADQKQPLTSLLRRDPAFELVHEDEVAAVFVRR